MASIVETVQELLPLTPAHSDFVLDGNAEQAWKGFFDRAATLATDAAAVASSPSTRK